MPSSLFSFGRFILYSLALVTPTLFLPAFIHGFSQPKAFFVFLCAMALIGLLIVVAATAPVSLPLTHPLIIGFVLLIASFTVSSITGLSFAESFWSSIQHMNGLLYYIAMGVIFLALVTFCTERAHWHRLFMTAIVAGVIVSLFSTIGREGLNIIAFSSIGGSLLGNTSHAGAVLLFPIFFALYLVLQTHESFSSRTRYLLYGSLGIMLANPLFMNVNVLENGINAIGPLSILGEARAASAALIYGLLLVASLYAAHMSTRSILRIGGTLMAMVLVVSAFAAPFLLLFSAPVQQAVIGENGGARIILWESGREAFMDRPFFGWGLEQFDNVNQLYFNPALFDDVNNNETWFTRAHNTIIDQLVAVGAIGAFIYFSLYAGTLYLLWRGHRSQTLPLAEAATMSAVLLAYFLQNLFFFDTTTTFLFVVLVLAFATYSTKTYTRSFSLPRLPIPFGAASVLAVVVFIAGTVYFVVLPAQKALFMKTMLTTQKIVERTENYAVLSNISPAHQESVFRFLSLQEIDLIKTNIGRAQGSPAIVAAEIKALKRELVPLMENNPFNYSVTLAYANLTNLQFIFETDPERQQEIIEEATPHFVFLLENFATNPRTYWSMVPFTIQKGETSRAYLFAEQAVKLNPNIEQSHNLLAAVRKAIEDTLEGTLRPRPAR